MTTEYFMKSMKNLMVCLISTLAILACEKRQSSPDQEPSPAPTPAREIVQQKNFCETHPLEELYETQDHHIVREFQWTHFLNCQGTETSASWETVKPPTKTISLPKRVCKALARGNTSVGAKNMTNCKDLGFIFSLGENCSIVIDRSFGAFNAQVEEGLNEINFYIHQCPESEKDQCQGKTLNEKYLVDAYRFRVNVSSEEVRLSSERTVRPSDCTKPGRR